MLQSDVSDRSATIKTTKAIGKVKSKYMMIITKFQDTSGNQLVTFDYSFFMF